ncbi:uncharacterized protein LOC124150139 [Haliotis rufescens]|uniref:uncharacterized protein LOC124150139 n=1 Tax=Haliotis rufescens TaxID=6454 RepID=UPI00201F9F15|nr:uncharacterized protein LOC124150139 [Haliotis rufescens]
MPTLCVVDIPTYNITSDRATDAVDVYDGISLTVDIRGFYCSAAHNLTLQVGSVTQPLNIYLPEAVTEPTNINFTISINVTESHFGDIELIFLCNGQQLNFLYSDKAMNVCFQWMTSMMTNESSGQILLLLTCLLSVSTELICPDTGFIDSSAHMSCSGGTTSHDYINPSGRNVAQCLLTGERCDVDPNMFVSVLNATHTTLTIGRVHLSDAGTWKCNTGSGEATCHLSVASIPACQITSPRDTSSLRIGEDLLLNISTPRYYCSDAVPLLLMMGKNDITLFNETVNDTTKEYFVVKQRMTASHFGIVKLFFECGNFRQALLCEGVQLLSLEYDNSFCSDETGSRAAIVMGIFIIIIVVIGILILVKNLRSKNDGWNRNQTEDNVVVGPGGSASGTDQQGPGLRINPAYVPTTADDRIVTTGTSTETGVMGGENLHPETRGEYVALDRNAVQPSNIYEHLGTYEEIGSA